MADGVSDEKAVNYTLVRPFAAEGARVGLVTCRHCGVALLLDNDPFNVMEVHDAWHAERPEEKEAT